MYFFFQIFCNLDSSEFFEIFLAELRSSTLRKFLEIAKNTRKSLSAYAISYFNFSFQNQSAYCVICTPRVIFSRTNLTFFFLSAYVQVTVILEFSLSTNYHLYFHSTGAWIFYGFTEKEGGTAKCSSACLGAAA